MKERLMVVEKAVNGTPKHAWFWDGLVGSFFFWYYNKFSFNL
jgi:hypothetical protein